MNRTDFYNLSPAQQKAERFKEYAKFFNSKEKTQNPFNYENEQPTIQGI